MTAGVIEITMAGIGPPGEAMGVIGGDLQGALPNPTIKAGVIDTAKLANLAVTDAKIASVSMAKVTGLADALLAKQDAIAPNTYAAHNDVRLSDERVPVNGSVVTAKIADNAVTDVKISGVGVAKVTGLTALLAGYATDAELTAETSRAIAAENVLSGRVTDETATRIANDDTLNGYIVAETARAQAAENTVAAAVETERLARINDVDLVESDLAAEESRALTAEGNLQGAINTEAARANAAELVISGNLTDEINDRAAADTAVQNFSINRANHTGMQAMSTVSGLEAAIAAQTTQEELDAEISRATAAEATKLTKTANLSDLTNVVTARTNLGLGTAAQTATTDYDPAGSAVSARTFAIQRANHTGTQAQSTIVNLTTDLAAKASQAALSAEVDARVAADALKADLVGGKVPLSQLDSVVISDFLGDVASEAAMLALVGMRGDWAIRTDLSAAFILIADNSTQLASWKRLPTPADLVSSVNGRTGVVSGLAEQTALTAETNRAVAGEAAAVASAIQRANHTGTQAISTVTGLQDALNAKATANDLTLEIARAVAAEDALATDVQGLETDVASLDSSLVSEIAARIADVDSAQAYSIQRSNHTGVQIIATVSGLQAALDAKAADLGVVHLAGAETVTGVKTFSGQVILGYVGTPADGTLVASQYSLWWDDAAGTGGLRVKGKDSAAGVVQRFVGTEFESVDNTKGVVLKSPDGTRHRVVVENDGLLSTAVVA